MVKYEKNIIAFIVMCVNEYAKRLEKNSKDTYLYLREYKGIEFLIENYEAEHTVGIDDVMEDLDQVCANNGGVIV